MRNTVSYLGFCAVTIALLVFLNATQPFVLSQIFGRQQNGSASGMLALVDELIALPLAPLWGALSDKIGTRYCAVLGLWIMALSLEFYPRMPTVYPGLLIARGLFSIGASGCVSMITAGLAELSLLAGPSAATSPDGSPYPDSASSSQFDRYEDGNDNPNGEGDQTVPLFEAPVSDEILDVVASSPRPNGKLAGMSGFASGIGAVFAVSALLPLPNSLGDGPKSGIIAAYSWVSLFTVIAGFILLLTMYQNPARGLRSFLLGSENVSIFDEAAVDAGGSVMSYLELLAEGFINARSDKRLQVAYFGSLVARSASVVLALFLPLWVNHWYYESGKCVIDDPNGCREAITQAAILTGIANTAMLLAAPLVGWAGDRYGSVKVLGWSSVLGSFIMLGLILRSEVVGLFPIILSGLLGVAEIGLVTMSMSMSTDKRRVAGGSVAGVYSFCGSLGILLVTQIGGPLADVYIKAPFIVLAVLFAMLAGASTSLGARTALRAMRSHISLR